MNLTNRVENKRIIAFILAMLVAFAYSIPATAFAESEKNTASVVYEGGTLYYDKNGNEVSNFDQAAVSVSKTVEKVTGEADTFKINLKVQAKEEVKTITQENDAAVVLVMDVSNSMVQDDKGRPNGRLDGAKQAAMQFLQNYVKDAGSAKRMVAVVEYGTQGKTVTSWVDANGGNNKVSDAAKQAVNSVENGFKYEYEVVEEASFIEWNERPFKADQWRCIYEGCADNNWTSEYRHGHYGQNHTHPVTVTKTAYDAGGTNMEAGIKPYDRRT